MPDEQQEPRKLWRVEIVVYEIHVDANGEEEADEVPYEEDVCDCDNPVQATEIANRIKEHADKYM